jgi:TRAP-type C4-dicarboxylate transport system permease small subunit
VALVCAEILARTVFGTSTLVADEYSGYLFVWITLIGFAHALQIGAFLRVDHLVSRLGPRGQALTDLLAAAAGIAVSTICVYGTGKLVLASLQLGTRSIQPSATPIWFAQAILPIGFAALVVVYLLLAGRAAARVVRS